MESTLLRTLYSLESLTADSGQPADEELPMVWETPQAIDFRFGMEITLYIANR